MHQLTVKFIVKWSNTTVYTVNLDDVIGVHHPIFFGNIGGIRISDVGQC